MIPDDPCQFFMFLWGILLTGAFHAGNGWVAGGCWDYHENDYEMDPFHPHSLRELSTSKVQITKQSIFDPAKILIDSSQRIMIFMPDNCNILWDISLTRQN